MIQKEEMIKLEAKIDNYIFEQINPNYDRYKYIYHLNLAHIDYLVEKGLMFSPMEKHINFSLTCNIHWAYMKLEEEENFNFEFDRYMYLDCFKKISDGVKYSMLCDEFPKIHSNLSNLSMNEDGAYFIESTKLPRSQYSYINNYSKKNLLNYILQYISGKNDENDFEDTMWELTKNYMNYWAEQFVYEDFKRYKREEWGGVSLFLLNAAMRRWLKLYKLDFNMWETHPAKLMIIMSSKWQNYIPEEIHADTETVKTVMEDFTYKRLGKSMYPKLNIFDAPVIQTKDNHLFANPFTILFNHSETRYLNYLRKFENSEYLKLKDGMKERHLPFISELVIRKLNGVKVIDNFEVLIPGTKKKRELDLFFYDEVREYGLYVEIKYFYNPISFSECKNLDSELTKALKKMPDQLAAIDYNWELLSTKLNTESKIKRIDGIVLSYDYLGTNVEVNNKYPIVNNHLFYESLGEADNLEALFLSNKEVDDVYNMPFLKEKYINFTFADEIFNLPLEYFEPKFELLLKASHFNQVENMVEFSKLIDNSEARKSFETSINLMLNQIIGSNENKFT